MRTCSLRSFAIFATVALSYALASLGRAASTPPLNPTAPLVLTEAIPTDAVIRIEFSPALRKQKIRIRNKTNARSFIIDLEKEQFIWADVIKRLVDVARDQFVPEFSVLIDESPTSDDQLLYDPFALSRQRILAYRKPAWRRIGFRTVRVRDGGILIYLDPRLETQVISNEEAFLRRTVIEDRGIKKLFEIGWGSLRQQKPEMALEAFGRALKRTDYLNAEQSRLAHLGRGIALFQVEGCGAASDDFKIADEESKNRDDVSFFRGICLIENKRYDEGEILLSALAQKNHPVYGDSARFYLGVIAEFDERYSDAESYYKDAIDFSKDAKIVEQAKQRQELLSETVDERNYHKWTTIVLTGGYGYDTNLISLPVSITPADLQLTSQRGATLLGVGSLELRPPWVTWFEHSIRYTFVDQMAMNKELSDLFDSRVHMAETAITVRPWDGEKFALKGGYSSVFNLSFAHSKEYVATPFASLTWTTRVGPAAKPHSEIETSFKFSKPMGRQTALRDPASVSGRSYELSSNWMVHKHSPDEFGPGFALEYRDLYGTENAAAVQNYFFHWDYPIFDPAWNVRLSHDWSVLYSKFFYSLGSRRDWQLRYQGSMAKTWSDWIETRLQFGAIQNISSAKEGYQYRRFQATLLVSAFF